MPDDRCDLLCLDLEKAERLRLERLDGGLAMRLAGQAKALSDPTRLTVAAALAATDELCVCDLAWVTERAENLIRRERLAADQLVQLVPQSPRRELHGGQLE